jgi:colanic acid biosynthesis glycosyl transferase WcaI
MHILIISMFYKPEPIARPHDLALTLTELGQQVTVVTAYPNYPNGRLYPNYQMRVNGWEEIDGVRVLRVPHLMDRSRSAIKRVLSYTSFSFSSFISGLLRVAKPDIIWTYQIGLPGVMTGMLKGIPLVHEVQDLWPDWGRAAGMGLMAGAYNLLERQELAIYRRATAIVTITDSFRKALLQKGVDPAKIEIIPNWVSDANFQPCPYDVDLAEQEGFNGYFNVVYVGNIGAAQSLSVVLKAAELLKDIPDVHFTIIGDGVERNLLEQQAREKGLRNVRFLGSRPQNQAAKLMALADVLFIHLKDDPAYAITIPSKTYSYMISGKPVLAAANGELAKFIQETHAGVVCPPEDEAALAKAVCLLREMPLSQRQSMGQAGFQAASQKYSRATLGRKYLDSFERAILSYKEERI